MEKIPVSGDLYQHFTGEAYRVVTTAKHAETDETFVVYQKLCGDFGIFVLPLEAFAGRTEEGRERFVLIPAPEIAAGAAGKEALSENRGPSEVRRQEHGERLSEEAALEDDGDASGLDAGVLAFLEAETYAEKLKVYASLAGRADEHMLNTIAVSMDLELTGGSVEEQYDNLKSCLLTLERYECSRLR